MSLEIRSQRLARAAFAQVEVRASAPKEDRDKYLAFARAFPTLIHTSGLAQAVAFALAKGIKPKEKEKRLLIDDLCVILHASGHGWLSREMEEPGKELDSHAHDKDTDAVTYMRLTRHALQAASWLKRYAEALLREPTVSSEESEQ